MQPGRTRLTEIPNSVCEYCGARNLVLHREAYSDMWVLYTEDARYRTFTADYRHVCEDRHLFQRNLEEIKEAIITGTVMRLAQEEDTVLDNMARSAEAMAQYEIGKAVDYATETLSDRIEDAIAKAIPVEHHIVVHQNGDAAKTVVARPHMSLPLLTQLVSCHVHTMMVGPTGSGKSTAGRQLAAILGLPVYHKNMGPDTRVYDLIGYLSPDGTYVPSGIAREPFENGGILMLDEGDNSNPSVLTTANGITSDEYYTFPDKEVKRHPDFICLLGANTFGRGADRQYVGRQQLDAATLDRFATLEWDYDEEAEFAWAGVDQYRWVEYVQRIRRCVFDNKLRIIVSPRASINGAKLLRAGLDVSTICNLVIWKGVADDQRNLILSTVGSYKGGSDAA